MTAVSLRSAAYKAAAARYAAYLLAVLGLAFCVYAGSVELIAGDGATEKIYEPFSVDFDSSGVMYGVEFTRANRVFRVADGKLTFIAGAMHVTDMKKPECNDGDLLSATFNGMHDISVVHDTMLYIADTFDHRIRSIDLTAGTVTTIAGGKAGFAGDGGPSSNALFNSPFCVTYAAALNSLCIADLGNARVRSLSLSNGTITTIAGNGARGRPIDGSNALSCPFSGVRAAVTGEGFIYAVLREGHSLIAVTNGIVFAAVNASGKPGYSEAADARDAQLNGPKYVVMDDTGRVLIADTENHVIRRYDTRTGTLECIAGVPRKAGTNIGSTLTNTMLKRPHGIRVHNGMLYIADSGNDRVLRAPYR